MIWYHIYLSLFCIPFVMSTIAYAGVLHADYRFHKRLVKLLIEGSDCTHYIESPVLDSRIFYCACGTSVCLALQLWSLKTIDWPITNYDLSHKWAAIAAGVAIYLYASNALCTAILGKYPYMISHSMLTRTDPEYVGCYYQLFKLK